MRVLLYTDAPGRGGAEISLGNLLAALPPEVQPHVVGVAPTVVEWVAARRAGTPVTIVGSSVAAHLAAFRRLRPDVVHVNRPVPWAGAAATAAALLTPRARVVAVEQLPLRTTSLPTLLRTRALALRLDGHVAVGAASARRVEDFYALGRGTLRSVPNGVPDLPLEPAARPAYGPLLVGSLGRLDRVKGYDVLLCALAEVDGCEAVVLGDGAERAALEKQAADLGLAGRVRWSGWSERARAALTDFDVFCLPSRSEGFPLSVVEAMLAGLPVVATDVGATAEALGGGAAGLLVPPDDPAALAGALRTLRDDPERRWRLGRLARDRAVELYRVERMAAAYVELWREVTSRPRAPRWRVGPPRP